MGGQRTALELLGGAVGGVAQAVVGHPLDLVKVRLQGQAQSGTKYKGMVDCGVRTFRQEGVRGLYKGVSVPIACCGVLNATLFTVNGLSKRAVALAVGCPR